MIANRIDDKPDQEHNIQFSRRQALRAGVAGTAALALTAGGLHRVGAQSATPVATTSGNPLPATITTIMDTPRYQFSRWGLHVADRATNEVIYNVRDGEWFLAASTTKLFSGAAALDAYGPDYRFETPIYRHGQHANGTLTGDLILVASGDLTMGGRNTPQGTLDYTSIDHINAEAVPLATLTPENPLAGLNDLARQVAATGINYVNGDVIIDDRLFPAMHKDTYILTPIWINDNLIDITITPGKVGQPATMVWRPETAAYNITCDVQTVGADQPLDVSVSTPRPGQIAVTGKIPISQKQLVQTFQVEAPSAFARTLLIEALQRQGIIVTAKATGPNPADKLPPRGSYAAADRVAVLRSLPFSQNIKLIEKVSLNQHADMLIFMLALKHGETTYDAGMAQIAPFLKRIGIVPTDVSLSDGRGNEYTDLFSPRTVSQLLYAMSTRPDFSVYHQALPILGIDGTEYDTVPATSPVRGKAVAKSGVTVDADIMNQRPVLMTRALAGYMTAKSGRELIFASYINNIPLSDLVNDLLAVIHEQGQIIEEIFANN